MIVLCFMFMATTDRSALERRLVEKIRQERISRPEQFNGIVMGFFDEVMGDFGRTEFEQHVLPRLLASAKNYETAGRRAARIIEQGSYKRRDEVAGYFTIVLGATVEKDSGNLAQASRKAKRSQKEHPKYVPHCLEPLKQFSPMARQDRLEKGLLRTTDGNYVAMEHDYAIDREGKRLRFIYGQQNRLVDGIVKFEEPVGKGSDTKYEIREIPISQLRQLNFRVYEARICFVATAVYGNPEALQVQILREFRDEVLMQHQFGRRFVDFYYSGAGERTANFIRERLPSSIPVIRGGLDLLVEKYSARKS